MRRTSIVITRPFLLLDIMERKNKFRLGEEFQVVMFRNKGILINVCTVCGL